MRVVRLATGGVVVLLALAQFAAGAAVIRLGTVVPDGSIWHQVLRQMGADWSRLSQGRVTLRVFAGTQGDEPTIIRKMRINQLQAASLSSVGLAEIDDAFNVFAIPMFFDSYEELLHVIDRLAPTLENRLEADGFVVLNWGSGGWVQVFSKTPVRSVSDLKALRLFTSAGDDRTVQWYKNNGFHPVPLALTDMMVSLQTGMIDAIPATPLAALSFQWYRHTPHMLDVSLGPVVGATVVTRKAWDAVPQQDRQALLDAAAEGEERLRTEVPKRDAAAIDEMRKRGLTVAKAASDDWRAAAAQFAATMRGTLVPPDIFDLAVRERDAFRQRAPTGASR